MQKYPNKRIFIKFAEKSHIFQTIAYLLETNLAIFGFFPSKKHDSERKFNDNTYFFLFFAYFSKTIGFGYEFCMQKYPNKRIFITFAEKSHLSENFQTG